MRNKLHSGPPATLKGEVAKTNVALNTLFLYIIYYSPAQKFPYILNIETLLEVL